MWTKPSQQHGFVLPSVMLLGADHLQWLGASSHGLAGSSEQRDWPRSKPMPHFSDAAGFGLTEVLVSAVLLGIFSSVGLQLSGSIGRAASSNTNQRFSRIGSPCNCSAIRDC